MGISPLRRDFLDRDFFDCFIQAALAGEDSRNATRRAMRQNWCRRELERKPDKLAAVFEDEQPATVVVAISERLVSVTKADVIHGELLLGWDKWGIEKVG